MARPCNCGSGLESYWLYDAAGIPCCRICEKCEKKQRAKYNPAIFDCGSAYAASGEEDLIGYEEDY